MNLPKEAHAAAVQQRVMEAAPSTMAVKDTVTAKFAVGQDKRVNALL